jgi:hypothetical protein
LFSSLIFLVCRNWVILFLFSIYLTIEYNHFYYYPLIFLYDRIPFYLRYYSYQQINFQSIEMYTQICCYCLYHRIHKISINNSRIDNFCFHLVFVVCYNILKTNLLSTDEELACIKTTWKWFDTYATRIIICFSRGITNATQPFSSFGTFYLILMIESLIWVVPSAVMKFTWGSCINNHSE